MSWIKLHRSLLDHAMLRRNSAHFMAWVEILMLTDYRSGRFDLTLAMRRMRPVMSEGEWKAFVRKLVRNDMIRVVDRSNRGGRSGKRTAAEVVNWGRYQGPDDSMQMVRAMVRANDRANDRAKAPPARVNSGGATEQTTERIPERIPEEYKKGLLQAVKKTELTTNHITGEGFLKELKALLPNASPTELAAKHQHLTTATEKRGAGHVAEALRITLNRFPPPTRPWAYLLATLSTPENLEQPTTPLSTISGGTPQPVRGQNRDFLDKRAELERQAEALMRRDVH